MRATICAVLLVLCAAPSAADPLATEMRRRNDELVKEGFNLTNGVTVTAAGTQIELLVPPHDPDRESIVTLWFVAERGELSVRMLGPGGEVVAGWRGRRGEQRLERSLAPGKYVVELGGAAARGLVGVKGPVVGRCELDAARVAEHAAEPAKGFRWPYLLLAPANPSSTTLLVAPNNTGFLSEDLELLRASAGCELVQMQEMADRLGVAVLVPLFPRTESVYVHALTRDALVTQTPAIARVDLQLIAMIDHARALLGKTVRSRVLMTGFSASGSFTNRFAVLHPDRVLAAAIGSPGGWPIAPSADLAYPVGIFDVAALTGTEIDLAALRKVRLFLFLGDQDTNDSVPYRDSFSEADEALVMKRFGKTLVARWAVAKGLYAKAGLAATFKLYPGAAHQVTREMQADLEAALRAAM